MLLRRASWFVSALFVFVASWDACAADAPASVRVLRPARVWTAGEPLHAGWVVVVQGNRILAVGPEKSLEIPAGSSAVELPDTTLLPGLMDLHSHLFLHPYNETSWDDQVLKEALALRVCKSRALFGYKGSLCAVDIHRYGNLCLTRLLGFSSVSSLSVFMTSS